MEKCIIVAIENVFTHADPIHAKGQAALVQKPFIFWKPMERPSMDEDERQPDRERELDRVTRQQVPSDLGVVLRKVFLLFQQL